jgi:CHRD domain-containing protein
MQLKWILRSFAVVAVLGLTVTVTNADEPTMPLHAKLTGFQEVPPKLTTGTGTFEATVTGSTLSYRLTFSRLSSDAIMAHIHFAQPAVNGGVFLWLCQSSTNPAPALVAAKTPTCPAGGGTVSRSGVSAEDILAVSGQNVSNGEFAGIVSIIESGDAYVNVHTKNFPGGEIRGQVKAGEN